MKLFLTCEHGGNQVPGEFAADFEGAGAALHSHRGYDPGALDLFRSLLPLADFSIFSETSRLLVELNRSLHHPQLFSEFSRGFSATRKEAVLEKYYYPYRKTLEKRIAETLEESEVLHISVHSFTPELNGKLRKADIGLLYDPSRRGEKEFCRGLKEKLRANDPGLNVRYNYPYLGIADGLPTHLRKIFPKGYYGIELEVNQKFTDRENMMQERVKGLIYSGLQEIIRT